MGNGTDAERLVCEGYGHFYTKGLNFIELRWSDFGTFTSQQVAKETMFLLLAAWNIVGAVKKQVTRLSDVKTGVPCLCFRSNW